ncbi:MAG: hypothetical protein AB8I08_16150 [Sandaracinaceae bacterium]
MGTRMHSFVRLAMALGLLALSSAAPAYAQLDQEPTDEPVPGVTDPSGTDIEDTEPTQEPPPDDTESGDTTGEETSPTLPGDPTGDADPLVRDERDYEPDQRGEHDAPDEPDEAPTAPPPSSPDHDEMRREGVQLTAGSAEGDFAEPSFYGFDVQLWLGGGLTSVEAFENQNLVRPDQQGGFGANLGLSAGLRMGPITVGPRATLTIDPSFLLITVGADVRAILTTDAVAPTLRASLSGVFLTGLSDALPSQSGAGGVHAELGVGVRWRFAGGFTFGAEVSGGYLHLDRQEEAGCTAPCTEGDFDLRRGGSSDGLTLRLNLSAGYRF